MLDDVLIEDAYDEGVRNGYRRGEGERIALATANSELRSQVRQLTQLLAEQHRQHTWREGLR